MILFLVALSILYRYGQPQFGLSPVYRTEIFWDGVRPDWLENELGPNRFETDLKTAKTDQIGQTDLGLKPDVAWQETSISTLDHATSSISSQPS